MHSTAYLKARMDERALLSDTMTAVLDKAAADSKDLSPEQRSQVDSQAARIESLDKEIGQLRTQLEASDRFTDAISAVARSDEHAERRDARRRDERPEQRRVLTFGEQFVQSDAFKNYRGRGTMEPVEFEDFFGLEQRAAGPITTDLLDIPPYQWSGPQPSRTVTPLLQVIGRESVSSGSVEYITWSPDPIAGGPVAEGAVKPEADIVPTTTPLSLDTYAHWKAITRQALEDYPRIRSIVEGKLRAGLAGKLESLASAVIAAAAFEAVTGPDLSSGIRTGIGVVQENQHQPNAILLNPADFAQLDIDASAGANNGPISFGSFWGLRPIAVGSLAAGTAYVGNFVEAVTWFDRNTTAVYMTDSHADYFVRNLLVILAEQRAAFAATDLTAAVKVTVTPAAPEAAARTSK